MADALESIKSKIWRVENPREHLKNMFNKIPDFEKMHQVIKQLMIERRKSIKVFDANIRQALVDQAPLSFSQFEKISETLNLEPNSLISKSIEPKKIPSAELRKLNKEIGPLMDKIADFINGSKNKKFLN